MKVEPMESGHRSETPEHSAEEVRREELEAMAARNPRAFRIFRVLAELDRSDPLFYEAAASAVRSSEERGIFPGAGGRARKVSVSLPEELSAAVQERVGRGEFSRYVSDAVARQLEADLLAELSALLEAEHGPVSGELLAEAEAAWPDAE